MKIILLATWPNGQTQHIYSTSSRLIAKSQHNAKLNRHVIEVTGPDAKFLSECIWHPKAMTPAVPVVVDENYNSIPLGSEFGPTSLSHGSANEPDTHSCDRSTCGRKAGELKPQDSSENLDHGTTQPSATSRELPVLPEQPPAQAQEELARLPKEVRDLVMAEQVTVTVDEEEDPEAGMPLEEVICKRIAQYTKLKVETLAANLGVTVAEIRSTAKNSDYLKITGTKKLATVSAK